MRSVTPRDAVLVPSGAKRVFKGVIFDVYQWQQTMFDGSQSTFEMLKRPDTVKVLALKDDKMVSLYEQQPGLPPMYEIPGGRHDVETENELACAQRELYEETGMIFRQWRLIDITQHHFKIEHFVYIFLATDFVKQDRPEGDPGEKISVRLITLQECIEQSRTPAGKYLPRDLLERAGSIEGLLALPEYRSS